MANWFDAAAEADLRRKGKQIVKAGGKQILLLADGERLFAINNRCPHEGYPLSEGTLGPACTLTCNWHNWKFDLASGETLVGGDRLRQYPIELRDGRIFIDVQDPPELERQAKALANLEDAVADNDYERMAREVARFIKAKGDPLEPLRHMIEKRAAHFEYGMTHAFAAAADWIELHKNAPDTDRQLTALVEPIAHIAFDTLREPAFEFTTAKKSWNADAFVAAIEAEREDEAIAYLNGALEAHVALATLRAAFARAALAHYQDFGHSAIYTRKGFELVERLGPAVAKPVLQSLVRSIIYATREDRIPEFRHYPKALASWSARHEGATAHDMLGLSVNAVLDRTAALGGDNEEKYKLMLEASALAMLRFDITVAERTDNAVSNNIGWLDFTHTLTFGNAVRELCGAEPALWPQALLQLACFLGRNASFLTAAPNESWRVDDADRFFAREKQALYDHGIREPIFACHRVKMLAAVAEEVAWAGKGKLADALLAATNRYLNSPMKARHALRAAHQALSFVDAEG